MKTRHILRWLAAVFALVLVSHARAQDVVDPAFNRFRSQVIGNQVSFSYGSGGTPLAGGASSAGSPVTGGIDVSRGVAVSTKHGPIAGSLTQKISNAAMGKAFGRAAAVIGGPVGLAFLALPAIVDWMDDAGVSHEGGQFMKPDPAACTTAPCYQYGHSSLGQQRYSSMAAVCAAIGALNGLPVYSANPYTCVFGPTGQNGSLQVNAYSVPPGPGNPVPASAQDVEDLMSAVTPSPEALAEMYKLAGPLSVAHPIPDLVDTLRADFDARSPESTETTTTEKPTETKTQEKTCATYTQLVGSTVSLVEQCETTTTTQPLDPVTGDPVGAPTVETETTGSTTPDPATRPEIEPQAAVCGGPGLPSCNVKVDETGTPTGETFGESADLDTALNNRLDGLATARDMAGDTGWGIVPAWTQDQACEPWDIFTLPDAIGGDVVTVDLCPLMPLAEGILNFIWVMLGIFAITSMVASAMTGKPT